MLRDLLCNSLCWDVMRALRVCQLSLDSGAPVDPYFFCFLNNAIFLMLQNKLVFLGEVFIIVSVTSSLE